MSRPLALEYPDGVWETTADLTDDDARLDWPVLRDAPVWQQVVTGPSGYKWTWYPWPRVRGGTVRAFLDPEPRT